MAQLFYTSPAAAFVDVSTGLPVTLRGINARTNCYSDQWPQSRWDKLRDDPPTFGAEETFALARIACDWDAF